MCYRAEAFGASLSELEKKFSDIPSDTDILITHAPPYGIRDKESAGNVGSEALLNNVLQRIKPYLHVFGHCHNMPGQSKVQNSEVLFVNTACNVFAFDFKFQTNQST